MPAHQNDHLAGVPPRKQKSLGLDVLEWFLVLSALCNSGIAYLPYYLFLTGGSFHWMISWNASEWIQYLLGNVSALGILGYVLFRNSRWCPTQAVNLTESVQTKAKPEGSRPLERYSDLVRLFEMGLILVVALSGAIFFSFMVLLGSATLPDQPITYSLAHNMYRILFRANALGLLGYVLTRRAVGFRELGFRWTSRDVAEALPLALGAAFAERIFHPLIFWWAGSATGHRPVSPDVGNYVVGTSISLATVLDQILNGFFEELIIRGYLMTEVKRFTGSVLLAIGCSVMVQISGHFYQGGPAAFAHVGLFLVFACFYAKTNRVLPIILAHIAIDLAWLTTYAFART